MKEIIKKEILERIGFAEKYKELCNRYKDYDNGVNFTKSDVQSVINQYHSSFKYSSREKCFSKDYALGNYTLRFIVSSKYGFIDCMYAIWSNDNQNRFRSSLGTLAGIEDPDFENTVEYKFPIATSTDELRDIMQEIFPFHQEFINYFEKAVDQLP